MKKRLTIIIAFLLILFAGVYLGFSRPTDETLISVIEDRYAPQIARLKEMASQVHTSSNSSDKDLFKASEILEALIQTSSNTAFGVGQKDSGIKWHINRPSFSQLNLDPTRALIQLNWSGMSDGRRITSVHYQKEVTDDAGKPVKITLVFDLKALVPE
jgi:hypothetical protein